jgi:secondary thiamine-phosphate synthase enzyme
MPIASRTPMEFLDITDRLQSFVAAAGVETGLLGVQSLHTTVGLVVNEHEPLLLGDFARHLERWAPAAATYAHDDLRVRSVNVVATERPNGHAHCRALVLAPSLCLAIVDGQVLLGRWQRVFVVELDGPQVRGVALTIAGGA